MNPVPAATERLVDVGGDVRLNVTEQGAGEAVVLCHGFPGLGYSWRHQLPALAAAGYRAIAPDMRGYGASDAPAEVARYDRRSTVADLTGLLDALGIERAVFVGHDFGAALTWDLPLWAPDRVRGLIQLAVPRGKPAPVRPSSIYAHLAKQHFLHFDYFQKPDVAEAELDPRADEFLQRVFWALSGEGDYFACWRDGSVGAGYLDVLPEAPALPWRWLSREEFDRYVDEFARTGFRGGLNWYRAADLVWEQNRPYETVDVPTLFVAGENDPALRIIGTEALETMSELVPGLVGTHLLPGAGHFVQMEAADAVNTLMLEFLAGL